MEPPPKPLTSPTSTSLFQVYLRLRPHTSTATSVPSTPSKSLYPTLPQLPERFLAVEPVDDRDDGEHAEKTDSSSDSTNSNTLPTHITLHPPSRGDGAGARKRAVEKFAFSAVFEEHQNQLDLFGGVGVPEIIEGVLKDGRDGLVATLGVTGSGKTHTILGSKTRRGLTQLTLELLFRSLDSQTVNPGHSPRIIPSLISADASEANICGAGSFLDGIYGDGSASRAATPMTVGMNQSNSALSTPNAGRDGQTSASVNPIAARHERIATKYRSGLFRQWKTLGLDRNFTPLQDRPINLNISSHHPQQDITHTSTPSTRRTAVSRPAAGPTLPILTRDVVASSPQMEYAIIVSMYEVYNDRIFDLLSYARGTKDTRRRPLLFKPTEGSPDRKVVAGLRKVVCSSYEEALQVLETGLLERRVAGTGSNSVSSRSHGFFCLEVKKRRKGGLADQWSGAHLTIVDLAGSERARNAKTAGATLAEAGKINESLMYLGQCLQMQSDALDHPKPTIVPFRQCKLTELLFSNSFPSTTTTHHHHPQPQRAVMIVNADPHGDFNATSQILRYSALAREVTVPRIPSVTTLVFHGAGIPQSKPTSGRTSPANTTTYSDETSLVQVQELEAELSRLTEQVDVLTLQLAEERVRRRDAQSGWRRAEEKLATLEETVRAEVVADMETQAARERRRWLEALNEAADASDAHWDRKLELLQRGVGSDLMAESSANGISAGYGPSVEVFEDATATTARDVKTGELEDENRELRARLRRLEQDLHTRSPTRRTPTPARGSALRNVFAARDAEPPKMSRLGREEESGSEGGASPKLNAAASPRLSPAPAALSPRMSPQLSTSTPPRMSPLGLGRGSTSRLGLGRDDPFGGLPSSPLVNYPARSPSPATSSLEVTETVEQTVTMKHTHLTTSTKDDPTFHAPVLPDDDDSSLFDPDIDDKENAPLASTLAATQALAALSFQGDSDDSAVERELLRLEEAERAVMEADDAKPKRMTRSSARVTRSSVNPAGSPIKTQASPTKNASPKKKSASAATTPGKNSATSTTTTPGRKMRTMTPHKGVAGRAVAVETGRDSWMDSSEMSEGGSGNWVVHE